MSETDGAVPAHPPDENLMISVNREVLAEVLHEAGVSEPDELINRAIESHSIYYRETSFYHGPYPQAEDIAAYEQAIPGSGDRIFLMAEKEQAHRHKMDELNANSEHQLAEKYIFHTACRNYFGQFLGGTALILGMLIGGWLIYKGRSLQGFVAMLGPLATVIGVFLYNEFSGKDNDDSDPDE